METTTVAGYYRKNGVYVAGSVRHKRRSDRKPLCHPDKPYEALDMCKNCYVKYRYTTIPSDHAQKIKRERRGYLRRTYGLTEDDYDTMLAAQGGTCAICKQRQSGRNRLSVDHEHETGRIRGLLCVRCNSIIGRYDADVAWLHAAISYLTDE